MKVNFEMMVFLDLVNYVFFFGFFCSIVSVLPLPTALKKEKVLFYSIKQHNPRLTESNFMSQHTERVLLQ